MGNSSSTVGGSGDAAADQGVVVAPADTAVPVFGSSGSSTNTPQRGRSESTTRRIVKASKPQAATTTEEGGDGSSPKTAAATDLGDFSKHSDDSQTKNSSNDDTDVLAKQHVVPNGVAETTPAVARELEKEQAEASRQERINTYEERIKQKREKKLQERRNNPAASKDKQQDKENLQANPFSRFLSVFSVEPAHPEHKRAFEGGTGDDGETEEPLEKRPRPNSSTEQGGDSDNTRSGGAASGESGGDAEVPASDKISSTAVAVAVVVVAVAVATFLRMKGGKN